MLIEVPRADRQTVISEGDGQRTGPARGKAITVVFKPVLIV